MTPGARLIVLGKQGAGKGTQAVRLSHHYVVPHIATGDAFRSAVRTGSEFGVQAKKYLDAGDLVPDDVVIGVVTEQLTHDDTTRRGFILDGFPRTVRQAEALVDIVAPRCIDLVVNLEVRDEVVMSRLAARRVCSDCGANYSTVDNRPRAGDICDICGGDVVQRADDTESAIRRRLELYQRETEPLIRWYSESGMLVSIDATGTPDEVTDRVVEQVERAKARAAAERDNNVADPTVEQTEPLPCWFDRA